MAKNSRRISPSRIKYEQAHPTISFRVSKEFHDRLQAAKETEGLSFADIVKAGLGLFEVKASNEKEAREQGFEAGFEAGFEEGSKEAETRYEVTYLCKVCRKPMAVTSTQEKEAIKQYMEEHAWGHKKCHDRKQ